MKCWLTLPVAILLFIALGLTRCAHKPVQKSPESRKASIGKLEARYSKPSIEESVRALLSMAGLESIHPSVNEDTGFVSLWGPIPDPQTRTKIIKLVQSIKGVKSVRDDLYTIAPVSKATSNKSRDIGAFLWDSRLHLFAALVVGLLLITIWRAKFWERAFKKLRESAPTVS